MDRIPKDMENSAGLFPGPTKALAKPVYTEYYAAVDFLFKVRNRLKHRSPEIYTKFETILNEFRTKQQAIYKHQNSENNIRGLIKNTKDKIKNLFGLDEELNKEFLYFLPENDANETSYLQEMKDRLAREESFEEVDYKLRVFREIREALPAEVYKLFLRTLNLFSSKVIDYKEMVGLMVDLLKQKHSESLMQFLGATNLKNGISDNDVAKISDDPDANFNVEKSRVRTTPGYVSIVDPAQTRRRSKGVEEILNTTLSSVPHAGVENKVFKTNLRNEYEERVLLFEDDLYELDVLLSINENVIKKLEDAPVMLSNATGDEETVGERFCLGLSLVERSSLEKMYGKKGRFVLIMLDTKPDLTIPIVLDRCIKKKKEWEKVKVVLETYWKRLCVNKWLYGLSNSNVPRYVTFQASLNADYLVSELNNACQYNESYAKSTDELLNASHATLGPSLGNVLRKHESFLLNAGVPPIAAFLAPLAAIRAAEAAPDALNFLYPRGEVPRAVFRVLDSVLGSFSIEDGAGPATGANGGGVFVTEEETAERVWRARERLGRVLGGWREKRGEVGKKWADIFNLLFNDCVESTAVMPEKNTTLQTLNRENLCFEDTLNPDLQRRFFGDEKWYLFVRLALNLIDSLKKPLAKTSHLMTMTVFECEWAKIMVNPDEAKNSAFSEAMSGKLAPIYRCAELFYEAITAFVEALNDKKALELYCLFENITMCLKRLREVKNFWSLPGGSITRLSNFAEISEGLCKINNLYTENCESIYGPDSLISFTFNVAQNTLGVNVEAKARAFASAQQPTAELFDAAEEDEGLRRLIDITARFDAAEAGALRGPKRPRLKVELGGAEKAPKAERDNPYFSLTPNPPGGRGD